MPLWVVGLFIDIVGRMNRFFTPSPSTAFTQPSAKGGWEPAHRKNGPRPPSPSLPKLCICLSNFGGRSALLGHGLGAPPLLNPSRPCARPQCGIPARKAPIREQKCTDVIGWPFGDLRCVGVNKDAVSPNAGTWPKTNSFPPVTEAGGTHLCIAGTVVPGV